MNLRDLAWLAGLLEGEGCFAWYRNGQWGSLHLKLAMTDKDVISKAAAIWKRPVAGPYISKSHTTWKPVWHTVSYGKHAASWMMTLYPFLGERRQAKIREVLSIWKDPNAYPLA